MAAAAPAAADDPVALPERLTRHVRVNAANGCWEWMAYCTGGYGRVSIAGRLWLAHRAAYEAVKGSCTGQHVLHRCDNPACINPSHLFLGDPASNAADRDTKKRQARGERCGRAKLTTELVRAIRKSQESAPALAKRYGVGRETVRLVRTGETWRHLL